MLLPSRPVVLPHKWHGELDSLALRDCRLALWLGERWLPLALRDCRLALWLGERWLGLAVPDVECDSELWLLLRLPEMARWVADELAVEQSQHV